MLPCHPCHTHPTHCVLGIGTSRTFLPHSSVVSVEVGHLPIHPPPLAPTDRSTAVGTERILRRERPSRHQLPVYHRPGVSGIRAICSTLLEYCAANLWAK